MINYQTLRRISMYCYTTIAILVLLFQLYEAKSSSDCKKNVCLTWYEGKEDHLALVCVVPNLYKQIIFLSPNNLEYAHCVLPFPSSLCHTTNTNSSIVQDLKTNQTILIIKDSITTDLNGRWFCSHGRHGDKESVDVVITKRTPDCAWTNCLEYLAIICGVSVVIITFSQKPVRGKTMQGILFLRQIILGINQTNSEETYGLCDSDTEMKPMCSKCGTCARETAFAVCCECQTFYCETCANDHATFKNHKVIQIKQIQSKNQADMVCIECANVFCSDDVHRCGHSHDNNPGKELIRTEPNSIEPVINTISEFKSEVLRKKYDVPLSSNKSETRMRGIAFLESGQFVVADYKARQLKIFSDNELSHTEELNMEPRGLTGVTRNRVAVTFAYEKKIVFFAVKQLRFKKHDEFNLKGIGKPFQIAYHNNHFVVEVNEGKDGRIVILNQKGVAMHVIPNNNWKFGYFTGNTFRLQLDMSKKEMYVAAIGKNTVYCLDFNGDIKWDAKVPSPRSLVVLPITQYNTSTLLLASRKASMIYKLICTNNTSDYEKYDVKLVEMVDEKQIEQPDYMAYDHEKKLLYSEVADGRVSVYDMVSHEHCQ